MLGKTLKFAKKSVFSCIMVVLSEKSLFLSFLYFERILIIIILITSRKKLKKLYGISVNSTQSKISFHITPRPVMNFTPNSYSSVVMPFTFEEFGFCQSLQNVKISAYRSNPLPQDYYNSMVTQKRFVRPEVGQQLSNCIQVFIERLIKFANDLDFFQR